MGAASIIKDDSSAMLTAIGKCFCFFKVEAHKKKKNVLGGAVVKLSVSKVVDIRFVSRYRFLKVTTPF